MTLRNPPFRRNVVVIRPEHEIGQEDLVVLLALVPTVLGEDVADPSPGECEAAIRRLLWESGNDFRERLTVEDNPDDRLAFGRELFNRHFTHLYPRKDPT